MDAYGPGPLLQFSYLQFDIPYDKCKAKTFCKQVVIATFWMGNCDNSYVDKRIHAPTRNPDCILQKC